MVYLCKVWKVGASLAIQLPMNLRKAFGLVHGQVIGMRIVTVQGHKLLVGEFIPLDKLARVETLPLDVLPHLAPER